MISKLWYPVQEYPRWFRTLCKLIFLIKGRSTGTGYHFQTIPRFCVKSPRTLSSFPYPLNYIIFPDFVCLRWDTWNAILCITILIVLNTVNNAWSSLKHGKILQHFILDRVATFTILCFEEGRWVLLSRPNPPSQIPLEYPSPEFIKTMISENHTLCSWQSILISTIQMWWWSNSTQNCSSFNRTARFFMPNLLQLSVAGNLYFSIVNL